MKVLGIDPGVERVGWGVVNVNRSAVSYIACGCAKTAKTLGHADRLLLISKKLTELVSEFSPEITVVERLFFSTNKKTGIAVAESRGVILSTLKGLGLEIQEYTPLEVKRAIVGNGKAEKAQVAWMVKNILKIKENIVSDDALDALALCLMART